MTASDGSVGMGRLIVGIIAFVAIGTPLVAYLWDLLNQVFAGYFVWHRIALGVPALLVLLLLFRVLSGTVRKWESLRAD